MRCVIYMFVKRFLKILMLVLCRQMGKFLVASVFGAVRKLSSLLERVSYMF